MSRLHVPRLIGVSVTVASLLLTVAACTTTEPQPGAVGDGTAPGGSSLSADALAAASKKTAEQGSGRFTLTFVSLGTARGDVEAIHGDGAFDNAQKRFQASLDLGGFAELSAGSSGLGGAGDLAGRLFSDPIELRGVGDDLYMKAPVLNALVGGGGDRPWAKFTTTDGTVRAGGSPLDQLIPFGGAAAGPGTLLRPLQAASDEVQYVRAETIDGVDAQHYRTSIDPARAKAKGVETPFGDQPVPADVWLDRDGAVRQVQYELDPSKASSGGGLGSFGGTGALGSKLRITMTITDPGQPVGIEIPPADDVSTANLGSTPGGR